MINIGMIFRPFGERPSEGGEAGRWCECSPDTYWAWLCMSEPGLFFTSAGSTDQANGCFRRRNKFDSQCSQRLGQRLSQS